MRFKRPETRMHGILDKTMHHGTQLILEENGSDLGQLHDWSFLSTANGNCAMRRFLRKKTAIGYFCWETPIMCMGVSQERKCLWILFRFCTSFVLHRVKKAFGGSGWKLMMLTLVSWYLAYVTSPHDWRIRVARGKLKTSWREKQFHVKTVSVSKNLFSAKIDVAVYHTPW